MFFVGNSVNIAFIARVYFFIEFLKYNQMYFTSLQNLVANTKLHPHLKSIVTVD